MRAYFVMYAMNAAVQKAGLLFHPWKKKSFEFITVAVTTSRNEISFLFPQCVVK